MYVLIALGLTLVYGVMRIPNFAHGEYYLFGAYTTYFSISILNLPAPLAILAAAVVGLVFGALIEKVTFGPLRKRNKGDWVMNTFLVAAGIQLIIQNSALYFLGAEFRGVQALWQGNIKIGVYNITVDRAVAFGIAMMAVLVFWIFLKRTRTGNAILSVAEHETGAMLMGVQIDKIHTLTYALSCMLAALAGGALISITPAYPTMGLQPLYAAWFVVILVGLGNLQAVLAGGFIVGLVEVAATYWLGAAWQNAVSLSVIVLVLIFKPSGLFGRKAKV